MFHQVAESISCIIFLVFLMWHNISRNLLLRYTKIRPSQSHFELSSPWSWKWSEAFGGSGDNLEFPGCYSEHATHRCTKKPCRKRVLSQSHQLTRLLLADFGVALLLFTQLQTQLCVTDTVPGYIHSCTLFMQLHKSHTVTMKNSSGDIYHANRSIPRLLAPQIY